MSERELDGKLVSRCSLCGKAVSAAPPLNVPLDGPITGPLERVLKLLYEHLSKYHARELQDGKNLAEAIQRELGPFMIISAFRHEDPSLSNRIESLRSKIFPIFRKNLMNDAALLQIVVQWELDEKDQIRVLAGMKALRDILSEIGEFSPKTAEPTLVIP